MEGAATTVYAQGGRGNSRLVAWEGERTVTFTMEDALISPAGFMILSGAGLVDATTDTPIYVHTTEQTNNTKVTEDGKLVISLKEKPVISGQIDGYGDSVYVMLLDTDGEISSEPIIPESVEGETITIGLNQTKRYREGNYKTAGLGVSAFKDKTTVLVDYYVQKTAGAQQIDITPDKFGGNYYLEASTLFRTQSGVDMPAEFIIPNCKIQSNFTFTMASSGDPSSFTFTMDAFPDYTRFDSTKKVLAAIQIIETNVGQNALERASTVASETHEENSDGAIVAKT